MSGGRSFANVSWHTYSLHQFPHRVLHVLRPNPIPQLPPGRKALKTSPLRESNRVPREMRRRTLHLGLNGLKCQHSLISCKIDKLREENGEFFMHVIMLWGCGLSGAHQTTKHGSQRLPHRRMCQWGRHALPQEHNQCTGQATKAHRCSLCERRC